MKLKKLSEISETDRPGCCCSYSSSGFCSCSCSLWCWCLFFLFFLVALQPTTLLIPEVAEKEEQLQKAMSKEAEHYEALFGSFREAAASKG